MLRYRINSVPRSGCKHHVARPLWRGPAHHGDRVQTPGHDHLDGHGGQHSRVGLPAPRLELTPWLEPAAQACSVPATARPTPDRTRTGKIRHGETRAPPPRKGCLARGWAPCLGIERGDLNWWPWASRPACPVARHELGRDRGRDLPGQPGRRAGPPLRSCSPRRASAASLPTNAAAQNLGPGADGTWRERDTLPVALAPGASRSATTPGHRLRNRPRAPPRSPDRSA
jgi:hypothetical protein